MRSLKHLVGTLAAAFIASACGSSNTPPPNAGIDAGDTTPRPRFEDYIRGDRHRQLVLEIDSVPGFEPRVSSQDAVEEVLRPLLDKPSGIEAVRDKAISSRGADHAWTFAELDELAQQTFDLAVQPDAVKMHVLFVDGHSDRDTQSGKILGIAWAHTHIVIFKKTIEDSCRAGLTGLLAERVCEEAEQGVWVHEIGHLLGLVDNGLPMVTPHEDPAHAAHDQSDSCVMFWAYETGDVFDELRARITGGGSSKLDFDAACKSDIMAVRNR